MDYLFEQKEGVVFAAVTLVSHLGCRPSELNTLAFLDGQTIFIPSSKKTTDGKRGLDRLIHIEDASLFRSLQMSFEMLTEAPYVDPVRYVQKRLATLTQRLWPKRKSRPSLYSWRHQLGSDLKAGKTDPAEIAVLMGHNSTDSVREYGNPRSQRDTRAYLRPDKSLVKAVRRLNRHRLLETGGEVPCKARPKASPNTQKTQTTSLTIKTTT